MCHLYVPLYFATTGRSAKVGCSHIEPPILQLQIQDKTWLFLEDLKANELQQLAIFEFCLRSKSFGILEKL
jgi:hypothetical protein